MTETGYAKESVAFCEQSTQRSVLIKKRLPGAKFHEGPVEGLLNVGSINFSRKAELVSLRCYKYRYMWFTLQSKFPIYSVHRKAVYRAETKKAIIYIIHYKLFR
jgi:hypothetical protein